jgi:hypothetical protein
VAHVTRRHAPAAAVVLVVAVAGVSLAVVAAHTTPEGYHARQPTIGRGELGNGTSVIQPTGRHASRLGNGRQSTGHFDISSLEVLLVIAVALVVVLDLWLRRRPSTHPGEAKESFPGAIDLPIERRGRLAAAVTESLTELERWPVREAIIACWLRLEATTDAVGLRTSASDTPEEYVRRVLAAANVRPQPLDRLAWLYREARFSRHAMSDVDRATAREALEVIQADLATLSHA